MQDPIGGVGDAPHLPTLQEHTAPAHVVWIQRKSLPKALLGFGVVLEQEAEGPVVQPVLGVVLVLSYPLHTRDRCGSKGLSHARVSLNGDHSQLPLSLLHLSVPSSFS